MIDLAPVRAILDEVDARIAAVDGEELTDDPADDKSTNSNTQRTLRAQKAQINRDLQYIADNLNLAASLVRNEMWVYKGERDMLEER